MSYLSFVKSLPDLGRQPTVIATLASLGIHGLVAYGFPMLSSSSNEIGQNQGTVPIVELTPAEQSRIPQPSTLPPLAYQNQPLSPLPQPPGGLQPPNLPTVPIPNMNRSQPPQAGMALQPGRQPSQQIAGQLRPDGAPQASGLRIHSQPVFKGLEYRVPRTAIAQAPTLPSRTVASRPVVNNSPTVQIPRTSPTVQIPRTVNRQNPAIARTNLTPPRISTQPVNLQPTRPRTVTSAPTPIARANSNTPRTSSPAVNPAPTTTAEDTTEFSISSNVKIPTLQPGQIEVPVTENVQFISPVTETPNSEALSPLETGTQPPQVNPPQRPANGNSNSEAVSVPPTRTQPSQVNSPRSSDSEKAVSEEVQVQGGSAKDLLLPTPIKPNVDFQRTSETNPSIRAGESFEIRLQETSNSQATTPEKPKPQTTQVNTSPSTPPKPSNTPQATTPEKPKPQTTQVNTSPSTPPKPSNTPQATTPEKPKPQTTQVNTSPSTPPKPSNTPQATTPEKPKLPTVQVNNAPPLREVSTPQAASSEKNTPASSTGETP